MIVQIEVFAIYKFIELILIDLYLIDLAYNSSGMENLRYI